MAKSKRTRRIRGGAKEEKEQSTWDYVKDTWLPRIFDGVMMAAKLFGKGPTPMIHSKNDTKIMKL